MRVSGSGSADLFMTAAPLAMLVVFVVWMSGGPAASLALLEAAIRAVLAWIGSALS
jgi:hypothetical protein